MTINTCQNYTRPTERINIITLRNQSEETCTNFLLLFIVEFLYICNVVPTFLFKQKLKLNVYAEELSN